MTKQRRMNKVMKTVWDNYVLPAIDKSTEIGIKPIPVDISLYENDYIEWKAKKQGKLIHLKTNDTSRKGSYNEQRNRINK
jgi:hypothetical protein